MTCGYEPQEPKLSSAHLELSQSSALGIVAAIFPADVRNPRRSSRSKRRRGKLAFHLEFRPFKAMGFTPEKILPADFDLGALRDAQPIFELLGRALTNDAGSNTPMLVPPRASRADA